MRLEEKVFKANIIPDDEITSLADLEFNQSALRILLLEVERQSEIYHFRIIENAVKAMHDAADNAKLRAQQEKQAQEANVDAANAASIEKKESFFAKAKGKVLGFFRKDDKKS